ncbi:MAG: hypothetical protein ACTSQI_10815 [Candidatus Helarchaeota archaeon]
MSLRLVMDQSHNEFLQISNTTTFQALLTELNIILFPLIDRPITLEKIQDDQILFIGCPSIPFEPHEIRAIVNFVEMGNFLILIGGSGGDLANTSNLSEIARQYEFEFNSDYVEDEKHNLNFSRIPIIYKLKKSRLFKQVKKIPYSGCSISILDRSTSPLMITDADSIPINSPLMVIAENKRVFGIGGYSLFSDDLVYGIRALDNLRFVYNLFEYIRSHYGSKKSRYKKIPEVKQKKVSLKSAKKEFLRLISQNIHKVKGLSEKIDTYWTDCSQLINTSQTEKAKHEIASTYHQLLQLIEHLAVEIGNSYIDYEALFPEFKKSIQQNFLKWYEIEADVRAKLDMIRNNLLSKLKVG